MDLNQPLRLNVGSRPYRLAFLTIRGTPRVSIGKEDPVGVVDLDELQEIGDDNLLRPLKPLLATVEDLDAGHLRPGHIPSLQWPSHLRVDCKRCLWPCHLIAF